eukprot:TRINITY_DN6518_c0_g1_i1.p1 TRINITY_DN6518_c0_g1~~TRINITY_DN6518_c0_g1_i1.p1  ORF type:complete len:282 (+),score=77.67 TRINITY_DN6518_c0_g1_i1:141-986(+)
MDDMELKLRAADAHEFQELGDQLDATSGEPLPLVLISLMEEIQDLEESGEKGSWRTSSHKGFGRKNKQNLSKGISVADHGNEDDYLRPDWKEQEKGVLEENLRYEEEQVRVLRMVLAQKCREVAVLRREKEKFGLSRIELLQFERRFVELNEMMEKKETEARACYATFNMQADIHGFLTKEISLLDSIHTQLDAALSSQAGRANLLSSLSSLAANVQQTADRLRLRVDSEAVKVESLRQQQQTKAATVREFYVTLRHFQEEYERGERLRKELNRTQSTAGH